MIEKCETNTSPTWKFQQILDTNSVNDSQFFKKKHQRLAILIANFAKVQPDVVGISET